MSEKCLTWNRVGESVGVFGDKRVFNVSSAYAVGSCKRDTPQDQTLQLSNKPGSNKHPSIMSSRGRHLPNKTSVFLLKAGSLTTSSYVTRSSWSNTAKRAKRVTQSVPQTHCALWVPLLRATPYQKPIIMEDSANISLAMHDVTTVGVRKVESMV